MKNHNIMHSDFWVITIFLAIAGLICTCVVVRRNSIQSSSEEAIKTHLSIVDGTIVDPGKRDDQGFRHMKCNFTFKGQTYESSSLRVINCSDKNSNDLLPNTPIIYIALDSFDPVNSIPLLTKEDYGKFNFAPSGNALVLAPSQVCDPYFSN